MNQHTTFDRLDPLEELRRSAAQSVAAARKAGLYAVTMRSMIVGRDNAMLGNEARISRRRSAIALTVLGLLAQGVSDASELRIKAGMLRSGTTFRDLLKTGEIVRTARCTYALTDKGRATLAKEAGHD